MVYRHTLSYFLSTLLLLTNCSQNPHSSTPSFDPSMLSKSCTEPGMLALTFDDGPTEYYDDLLTHLEEKDAKATFYVLGWTLDNPDHIERLKAAASQGHQIDNHTWGHSDVTKLTDYELVQQISDTANRILEITGSFPASFRPPYGSLDLHSAELIQAMGYPIILWNLDTKDWDENVSKEKIFKAFQDKLDQADPTKESFIALQHDKRKESVDLVPEIIDLAREKGFRLVTINECLGLSTP